MFREFALKSGIRGFTYADTSNNLVKLMWYGIVCVCTGMTINDVYGTVRYFMSFPTTTKVMLMNNDSIDLGSPTLCIPYANHLKNLKEFRNGTKDEIYELLDSTLKNYIVGSANINGSDLKTELVQTALSLIVAVVASAVRAEHFTMKQTYNLGWGYIRVEKQNDTGLTILIRSNQVEFAYNWLQHNNILIKTAATIAIKLLCRQFSFTANDYSKENYDCDVIKPTWLGMEPTTTDKYIENLCFQLPSKLLTFTSNVEHTYVRFWRPQMYQNEKKVFAHFTTLDFSSDSVSLYRGISSVYQEAESTQVVKVAISAQYKQLNRQLSPCSIDNQLSMCLFSCRKQFIRQWCNCTPLDVSATFQPLNECSVTHFTAPTNANCSKRIDLFNNPSECLKNCHPKCDRKKITADSRPYYNGDNNKTQILVYMDTFDYPIFEEIPLLEAKQVLGSIGGNLSLYLGANFMLLYYTAFYWMTAVVAKLMNMSAVAVKK